MNNLDKQDEDLVARYWEVQGRNGYWAVDEHRTGSSGTYGSIILNSRASAREVASALNTAYRYGILDGRKVETNGH
jgi:hypothetical protein